MEKVFVVIGSCGEYSDHEEWPVTAHATEDEAKAKVERCAKQYREHREVDRPWTSDPARLAAFAALHSEDPGIQTDYTGTNYYYWEVPFVAASHA